MRNARGFLFTDEAGTGNREQGVQMAAAADYRELTVWQEALMLAELVYCATKNFPAEERFGLTFQVRRAAASVPSCIAEGNARSSTRDYLRFLSMASGSLAEVETQLVLSARVGYLPQSANDELMLKLRGVHKLLHALKRVLGQKDVVGSSPFPVPRSRSSN
jgi:four helix bundle protein